MVQMLLRRCTHQPKANPARGNASDKSTKTAGAIPSPSRSPEEARLPEGQQDEGVDDGRATLFSARGGNQRRAIVPLSSLILRGNCVTDAGAVALAPLVEASHSLVEVDLRGNSIGKKGKLALKKVMACFTLNNKCTISSTSSSSPTRQQNNHTYGVHLLAKLVDPRYELKSVINIFHPPVLSTYTSIQQSVRCFPDMFYASAVCGQRHKNKCPAYYSNAVCLRLTVRGNKGLRISLSIEIVALFACTVPVYGEARGLYQLDGTSSSPTSLSARECNLTS